MEVSAGQPGNMELTCLLLFRWLPLGKSWRSEFGGGGAVSGGNSDAFLASITFVIWGVSMSYLDRCFLINHFYLKFISKATFI